MNLTLRLKDLPAGYVVSSDYDIGSDGACYRAVDHDDGTPDPDYSPNPGAPRVECSISFADKWRPSGRPDRIDSAVIAYGSPSAADAAFAVRDQLAAEVIDDFFPMSDDRPTSVPIADEARWWPDQSVVAWRSGSVLGFLRTGRAFSPNPRRHRMLERAAMRLALRQQARIANPTLLAASDNDDSEVALDSPRLGVAVHWLGRRLDPGGGLPPLELFDSESDHGGAGWRAQMLYVGAGGGAQLTLWKPRMWKRIKRSVIGNRIFRFSCSSPQRISIRNGRAAIYSTRDRPRASCTSGTRSHFFALVRYRGSVVTVNAPQCVFCVLGREWGSFNSPVAMRALVRGLERRL